jgi:hypothetical protein
VVFPDEKLDAAWLNALQAAMAPAYCEIPGSGLKSPGGAGLEEPVAVMAAGFRFHRRTWCAGNQCRGVLRYGFTVSVSTKRRCHSKHIRRGRFFYARGPKRAPRGGSARRDRCCRVLAGDDPPGAARTGNAARQRCWWARSQTGRTILTPPKYWAGHIFRGKARGRNLTPTSEYSGAGGSVRRVREGVKDRINDGCEGRALTLIPDHNRGRIARSSDLLQFSQFPTQRLQPKRSPHFRFFRHSTLRVYGVAKRKNWVGGIFYRNNSGGLWRVRCTSAG